MLEMAVTVVLIAVLIAPTYITSSQAHLKYTQL